MAIYGRSASPQDVERERVTGGAGLAVLTLLLFTSGAAALIYQVLWIKQLSLLVGVDAYAVTTGVSAFFAGLALGGALFGRWADRLPRPFLLYAFLEFGTAVFGVVTTWTLAYAAFPFVALEATVSPLASGLLFACVGVPATLMGGTLPALIKSWAPQPGHVGAAGGILYAANTGGAVAGALLSSFLLLPLLGIRATALASAAINLTAAIGALSLGRAAPSPTSVNRPPEPTHLGNNARLAVVLYAVAGILALGYEVVWSQALIQFMSTRSFAFSVVLATYLMGLVVGSALYACWADRIKDPWGIFGFLIAAAGLVALLEIAGLGRWLVILQTMAEAAVLALTGSDLAGMCARFAVAAMCIVFVPTVLLGAGHRTRHRHHCRRAVALPRHGAACRRGAVAGRRPCRPLFQGNFGAASDPKLEIRIRDGRRELLRNPQPYDLITLEPPPPTAAGVVNLYSSDFYRLAGSRLRQGGLLAQWWPLPTQNDEDSRALVRSFLDVFPHASLWTSEFHEMLLIGSFAPIELHAPRISARFEQPGVAAALREVGIASPAVLLATWITDRGGLERYVDGMPPVTDDQPRIEYATWVRPKEFGRVLPRLLALRSMPPLRGADEAFLIAVADERDRLLAFYEAGLHAYNGERELWARGMRQVMREDGDNPYYRWFVGGAR